MRKYRKSDPPSLGVIAVARAVAILDAFRAREDSLRLADLQQRTGLPKTTVIRITRTLAVAHYLVQLADKSWRLGSAAGVLGSRYQACFDRTECIEPVLRDLARATKETAIFSIREGDTRVCVARVLGPQPVRHHVRIGEIRPIGRGAPGRVLLAFSGEAEEPYDTIRQSGFHITSGERDPLVGAIALPVFGVNRMLIGCVSVSGPIERLTKTAALSHIKALRRSASKLTYELGRAAVGVKIRKEKF